jgi:hypothetical protein
MKRMTLLTAIVLTSLVLIAASASTAVAAGNPDCFSQGSGHPGCRIVQLQGGNFGVPLVVGSASLWLQTVGDESDAGFSLRIFYNGTFFGGFFPASATVGILLQLPGEYLFQAIDSTDPSATSTGAVIDTMRVILRG